MLIRPADAGSEEEWRALLDDVGFGHVVAATGRGQAPVIVPTHFVPDDDGTVLVHVARDNPLVAAVAADPVVVLAVLGPYCYVPAAWGGTDGGPPPVPTSYYASVQLECRAELVTEPAAIAALLARQLRRLEPEQPPPDPDDPVAAGRLRAIVGLRLRPVDVRAKFKFGGNRPRAVRERIAARLAARAGPGDLAARRHLLARTPPADDR